MNRQNDSNPMGAPTKDETIMGNAKETVTEYGQKGKEQADAGIEKAATGLQDASEKLRGRMEGQDGVQAQAGTKIADGMDKTATYLREHNTDEVFDDLEKFVREHPLQAVAGAAIGGFLISRVLL